MSKLPIVGTLARGILVFAIIFVLDSAHAEDALKTPASHSRVAARQARTYAGFDKNAYPGDDLLPALAKRFAFTGYWLNDPPGMSSNEWAGKRGLIRSQGLGFVVLFNGRLDAELKGAALRGRDAASLGRSDAAAAVAAAEREGFPAGAVIFLDQEEGGHLLAEQSAYLFTWIDAIERSAYRAGVYCPGIAAGANDRGSTAGDIVAHYPAGKAPAVWVANDRCPPAPGCLLPEKLPAPSASGIAAAAIWQYAQSPRRAEFTAACAASYAADNGCYVPGLAASAHTAVDLNSATSPDPSGGR